MNSLCFCVLCLQTGVAFGKALACTEHSLPCANLTFTAFTAFTVAGLKQLRIQIHEIGTHRANQAMVVKISEKVIEVNGRCRKISGIKAERGRLATFIADEGIEERFKGFRLHFKSFELQLPALCAIKSVSEHFANCLFLAGCFCSLCFFSSVNLTESFLNNSNFAASVAQEIFELVTNWEPVFQQFIGCQKVRSFCEQCLKTWNGSFARRSWNHPLSIWISPPLMTQFVKQSHLQEGKLETR